MPNKLYHHKFSVIICLVLVPVILLFLFFAIDVARSASVTSGNDLPVRSTLLTTTREIEIGAFVGVSPPTTTAVNEFESLIDRHLASVMWYQGWGPFDQPSFPCTDLKSVLCHDGCDSDITFHLTLEPWVDLEDIANGDYDAPYLITYTTEISNCGLKTRLRFAHEMIENDVLDGGEWYPWQDQPITYTVAFRHIHDVFEATGATNVEFVWCPNSYPFELDILQKYYPGPEYVDWLCMDGYNWTNQDGQPGWPDWQWFDDIFYNIYYTFTHNVDVFGEKPVMIGEFASCEAGPYEQPWETKPDWITNTFDRIKDEDYSKIQAFYWFNIDKECDWQVNSSPESLAAFRDAIKDDPPFTSHPMCKKVYLPVIMKER